ncbi:acyl-CoA dehydrogenase family protein [Gordonia sp. (in: high G+C Gram-positive bacteria)]|jgi:alkylation response protein AidB-like acyl-CoA dehydrogenase|uniref:acyl-CoA dehydrogenase family protein n=1 Tax=Gordonia sp. (in: high G+C Gram-positive bacteria) TaxID=84139 RepID=UPI001D2004F4|nr:acyl-CoA dehydrogenase family protein [Gordonia sp. (in: high G+C Gram-positive bacteria)]MCB1297298.1 acyl-CoA dehydrogenase family protein [Gordonia sp. (in: high G+C Gram-positive bacteria)]HMS74879.1 acyl-CoA dehydrogenase family protein [Gordonia sp. (in: high G+C Gram-positive bacteria)]
MTQTTDTAGLTPEQRAEYLALLTPENLSALMRSTWTWDDRALRRTLSDLIVDLSAVAELRRGDVVCTDAVIHAAESRVLAATGEFIAEVLGPRLLIDTGNPFRAAMLTLTTATAALTADAERALDVVAQDVTGRVIERTEELAAILPEDRWPDKAFTGSAIHLARVAYSAGYTLSPTPYFGAAGLGAQAFWIAGSPTDDTVDVHTCTLAAAEKTGSWDPALVKTRATPVGDGWEITGEKWYVPGASDAATLLVIARTIGGPSLYAVERSAPGVTVEPLDGLDEAHQLSRITFEAAPGRLIGRDGAGGRIMNRTVDKAGTVLAGEQMGLVDRALGDYSQVPPSCDDDAAWRRYTRLIAGLEVARCTATALWYRAVTLQGDDDLDAASVAAAIAHIGCSRAVRRVALLLGSAASGIDGEVVAGLRNRARTTDLLLGGPALAHERMLERLGI